MPYPYESGLGYISPIALVGHNVAILYERWRYYKVSFFEAIPPFQALDFGALAAGATTPSPVNATNLQLDPDEFAQFRWYPIDDAQIILFAPSSSGRAHLRNLLVPFDMNIVKRDPCLHLTEFYVWQDKNPAFSATAGSMALTQCRIIAFGFRFHGEVITDVEMIDGIQRGTIPAVKVIAQGLA